MIKFLFYNFVTVNSQQSTVNSQQSTVNSQQSTFIIAFLKILFSKIYSETLFNFRFKIFQLTAPKLNFYLLSVNKKIINFNNSIFLKEVKNERSKNL